MCARGVIREQEARETRRRWSPSVREVAGVKYAAVRLRGLPVDESVETIVAYTRKLTWRQMPR